MFENVLFYYALKKSFNDVSLKWQTYVQEISLNILPHTKYICHYYEKNVSPFVKNISNHLP